MTCLFTPFMSLFNFTIIPLNYLFLTIKKLRSSHLLGQSIVLAPLRFHDDIVITLALAVKGLNDASLKGKYSII
jgi:hypothetical protein